MGLFGFLKKGRGAPPSEIPDKSEERTSVFRGDLALLKDTDMITNEEQGKRKNTSSCYVSENKDSEDSIVYMSFSPAARNVWVCSECGTRNEKSFNGCVVCGLKK